MTPYSPSPAAYSKVAQGTENFAAAGELKPMPLERQVSVLYELFYLAAQSIHGVYNAVNHDGHADVQRIRNYVPRLWAANLYASQLHASLFSVPADSVVAAAKLSGLGSNLRKLGKIMIRDAMTGNASNAMTDASLASLACLANNLIVAGDAAEDYAGREEALRAEFPRISTSYLVAATGIVSELVAQSLILISGVSGVAAQEKSELKGNYAANMNATDLLSSGQLPNQPREANKANKKSSRKRRA